MNTMLSKTLSLAFLLVLLGGCVMGNVREDDPYAVRLRQVEEKLAHIERLTRNDSLLQLAGQVQQLQREIRELRGEVERLNHQVQSTQDRQRDLYLDIDRRLQALEAGGSAAGTGGAGSDDRDAYQAAFELLKQSRYEEAKQAFQAFLQNHADSALADNAQYWLGEARYVTRDFAGAIQAFQALLDRFPQSAKRPDAWLKLGYSHYEQGAWAEARKALETVIARFPDHAASRLAKQRLDRMQQEGR